MSGFVAIVASDGRTRIVAADFDGLLRSYQAVRGSGRCSEARAGDWAVAAKIDTPSAEMEGIEATPDGWAMYAGAVYGPRPLRTASLDDVEGQFAMLRHTADRAEIELVVDPFGMQTAFVASRGPFTYISTSSLALARHLGAAADRDALLLFLRAGIQFGPQTHWAGIRRLEPATRMVLGPDRRLEERYWTAQIDRRTRAMGFDEAVTRAIDSAVEAWAPLRDRPTSWSDLTGGFDTRLLNLLLVAAGVPVEPQTRETRRGEDADIAKRVAHRAGWPWTLFRVPADWPNELPSVVPQALGWSDGHLDALHLARNLRQHAEAAQRHRALFVGIGGDHFRGHAWRQEMYREGRSNRVNYDNLLDMRLLHPIDSSLFERDPTAGVRGALRQRVEGWVAGYRDQLNTVQLDVIHAYKMTGHAGAFCSADGAHLRAQLPFYFRAVFTTAFSIDHRHRNNHRLMRHMIERLDPRVAAEATETGGPAEALRLGNAHRFLPYYAKLGRKAANKVSYRLTGREVLPVHLPIDPTTGAAVGSYVRDLGLKRSTMRSGELYSSRVDGFLAAAGEERFSDLDLLGRIVTVELALRAASP